MDISLIDKYKVVPVVVLNNIEDTLPTLGALCEGGLPIAEITFRTQCAEDAIKLGVQSLPNMLIGAGTVINSAQCLCAISAGAQFIVGPGFDNDVADVCIEQGVPYFPGCVTPTEIMLAVNKGCRVIKFFPAGVYGGLTAMKALAGPFPQIKFVPTGGVDASNLAEYLGWDKIHAVGGSWMMKGDIVSHCKAISAIVSSAKE